MEAAWDTEDNPQNYTLSDHDAIVMEIKSNCKLRIRKFVTTESYKLAPFLSSVRKQLCSARLHSTLLYHCDS